jgi:hypothetical protein
MVSACRQITAVAKERGTDNGDQTLIKLSPAGMPWSQPSGSTFIYYSGNGLSI